MATDPTAVVAGSTHVQALPAHGVWVPALTPLNAALDVDRDRHLAHVRWLLAEGCHGVTLFGTTGEATSFSVAERKRVLEQTLEAGVSPERLMVGCGCTAPSDTVELTRHATESGVYKVLLLPPFYYKGVSDEGLFRSYAHIVERVGCDKLQIFLYHFPRLSTVPLGHELVERLMMEFPDTVVGFKDSSGDRESTRSLIETFPGLAVFPGTETLMVEALRTGGEGCITATANINPAGIRGVYDSWRSGDDTLSQLEVRMSTVRKTVQTHAMIPALKFLVAKMRSDPGWRAVRPPLVEMDESTGRALADQLGTLGMSFGA